MLTVKQLAFFTNVLNHHQMCVADELYVRLGESYVFVELCDSRNAESAKGGDAIGNDPPYLLRAWRSEEGRKMAMEIAITAEACVFSTEYSLPYQRARLKGGLVSFEMGERWLKRGVVNLFSPRLIRNLFYYHTEGWKNKPLYKLCASAYAAEDQYKLGTFMNKCYKWGYFTSVDLKDTPIKNNSDDCVTIMWCARFLELKHPELAILLSKQLKSRGYKFRIKMYGAGEYESASIQMAKRLNVGDVVEFHGAVPNHEIREAMAESDIFIFTSDGNEGWGAVANESMSEGCVLVASDAIGSSPYLIIDGWNGFMFKSPSKNSSFRNPDVKALNSLCEKVEELLNSPEKRKNMQYNARENMRKLWSPANAAASLLSLIDDLKYGRDSSISDGPCSKA